MQWEARESRCVAQVMVGVWGAKSNNGRQKLAGVTFLLLFLTRCSRTTGTLYYLDHSLLAAGTTRVESSLVVQ